MAAKGTNDIIYNAGMIVFLVGLIIVFVMIHHAYDEKKHH